MGVSRWRAMVPALLCAQLCSGWQALPAQPSARRIVEPRHVALQHSPCERKLHSLSRIAILRGRHLDALLSYYLALSLPQQPTSSSYLLLALHLQRMGATSRARQTFRQGVAEFRNDPKLLQAWGLFESKQGNLERAKKLIMRAVAADPSLCPVLRWKLFRAETTPATTAHRRTSSIQPSIPQAASRTSTIRASVIAADSQLCTFPAIRYTVPLANLGWRGRPTLGEDPSSWYDASGKRNGPPLNYWRQAIDERIYESNKDVVSSLLSVAADPLEPHAGLLRVISSLENSMSIRHPQLNRKLLGNWTVLTRCGHPVFEPASKRRRCAHCSCPLQVRTDMHVRISRARDDGQEGHFQEGEALIARISSKETSQGSKGAKELTLAAGKRSTLLGGNITYLSDYLMIQRFNEEPDSMPDVWMRVA
ncbi:MAG: hypothetical protein SGPRY_003230 [Prymnesium sp.]